MMENFDTVLARDPVADEQEVRAALAKYTDAEGKADHHDFIPTRILHQLYRDWRARTFQRHDPTMPRPLNLNEFGVVLRHVFRRAKRKLRQYHGQGQLPGYCNVAGPLAVRSPDPIKRNALAEP